MSFADETARAVEASMRNLTTVVRETVVAVAFRIIEPSPVDTGLFKGSWRFGDGDRDRGVPTTMDKSGAATIAAVARGVREAQIGREWFLYNNQPYAIRLENGHSKQAAFMVRNGALAAPQIASQQAQKVRGAA